MVNPTERVDRIEHIRRQSLDQDLQLQPVFPCKLNLEYRMIRSEHLRQHLVCEARGERPLVNAFLSGQFFALLHGDGDFHRRFYEQIVLGEKAGEQHAVPVLIGTLVHEMIDPITARTRIGTITKLAGMCAQLLAQPALGRRHVRIRLVVVHGERLQRNAGAALSYISGLDDRALELSAKLSGKCLHLRSYDTTTGPCLR